MIFEEFKLANGLRVLLLPTDSDSVTTFGLVKVGSRYEKAKEEGLAHFYEHMVFKGTEKFPNKKALALAADRIGADYNGATSQEYTCYYAKTAKNDFGIGLDLVSQLLMRPLLVGEEIKTEMGVILEELNMYRDTPQYRSEIELAKLLFPDHPLGNTGLGQPQTINSFSQKDFAGFKTKFYIPERMVLVVCGGFSSAAAIKKQIEKAFLGSPSKGDGATFLSWQESQDKGAKRKKIIKQETDQVHLSMGVRCLSRSDKYRYAQDLLNIILGEGMSSRLFQEIREKRGLCYSVHSSTELFSDSGVLEISAGLNKNRVDEAIEEIQNQLFTLAKDLVGKPELDKAKHFFQGKITLALEDSRQKAHFYGQQLLLEEDIKDINQVIRMVKKVDVSDILAIAKNIFVPNRIRIALVGNVEGGDI